MTETYSDKSATLFINGEGIHISAVSVTYPPPPADERLLLKPFTFSGEFTCAVSRREWMQLFPLRCLTWKQWIRGFHVTPKRFERGVKRALRRKWVRYQGSQQRLQDAGCFLLDRDYYPIPPARIEGFDLVGPFEVTSG